MQKAHFSFNSGRNVNSNRRLALTAVLLMTILLGLFPASTSLAQQNDEAFIINDIITEDTIGRGIVIPEEVALDEAGNRYVFGKFEDDVEFGESPNSQLLNGTDDDLFVAKYDTANNLLWVQEFETGNDRASATPRAIKFDETRGNIYVAGEFRVELQVGAEKLTGPLGRLNGFIAQLNPETGDVRWVNQMSSPTQITVSDISTNGNVVVTGSFFTTAEFADQFGNTETLDALTPNSPHIYIALYDFTGKIDFAIQAGGGNSAFGSSIVMQSNSDTFTLVGDFLGTIRFPDRTSRPPITLTSQDFVDGFVARYDNGELLFVTPIAGPNSDRVLQVVEKDSALFVAGSFTNQTRVGSTTLTSRGDEDLFVARLSTLDGSVQRVTQIGGDGRDRVSGFDGDNDDQSDGNVFITGEFRGDQITIGTGSQTIQLDSTASRTTYIAGISVDSGLLRPLFGQVVQGIFNPNRITVDDDSTNFYLAGSYARGVTFGEGNQTIELPRPSAREAMAIAHFVSDNN